ncbi:hypothetical protein EMIHUDRAFT_249102 [Emiliania huxleyi CCMP1516]|uniref:N-acetyltransferase domain-containing protein n=2 Tax=Emiliania huxleyi TaxID=2903 RepID=A0A0D3IB16_EMIH1|nr:hypothetical protein EMIHUDRAFT_249102 [Emiliania huxleyi CCMP1516]EOD08451.1 hypothetical protein EMIHUDRAFT_249102 [Emiliania huxleyi CCMP1516]|eukprot:XP_005760880.1 hypothetical protein EMIHUDRAFT_249102 [Emiliania huxleyi CCMP1516]
MSPLGTALVLLHWPLAAAALWDLRALAVRPAAPSEAPVLLSRLVRERMNPLSVDPERFLVAWDEPNGIAAFGQIRPLGSDASELASLVVEPRYRGLGVGTMLAAKLLARHRSGADSSKPLYLVTLQRTQPFYERLGFAPVSSPPTEMRLEVAAGSVVARLAAGQNLVCMSSCQHDRKSDT